MNNLRFKVAADPVAVSQARLRVKALDDIPAHVLADAELVVSELVTNSLLHAGLGRDDVIDVRLARDETRLVIEVDDHDGFFGKLGKHGPARRAGGTGLKVLDEVCECWHAEGGRVVASLRI